MDTFDKIGDLTHRAVDYVTGAFSPPSTPNKPAATEAPADDWLSRMQQKAQSDRNANIDKAVTDNGG